MSVRLLQNIPPALYLVCGGHFVFCELDAGEGRSSKNVVLCDIGAIRERWGINLSLNSFRVQLCEMDCAIRTD